MIRSLKYYTSSKRQKHTIVKSFLLATAVEKNTFDINSSFSLTKVSPRCQRNGKVSEQGPGINKRSNWQDTSPNGNIVGTEQPLSILVSLRDGDHDPLALHPTDSLWHRVSRPAIGFSNRQVDNIHLVLCSPFQCCNDHIVVAASVASQYAIRSQ